MVDFFYNFPKAANFRKVILLLLFPAWAFGQPTGIPLHAPAYRLIDRLDILGDVPNPIHPELKFYPRPDVVDFAAALDSLSPSYHRDLQYLFDDSNEWVESGAASSQPASEPQKVFTDSSHTFYTLKATPAAAAGIPRYRENERPLFGIFYKTPANFFEVNSRWFRLKANPMLNFELGRAKEEERWVFQNQRGLELRGDVDGRVFFYTSFLETQARFADYVNAWIAGHQAVPGNGSFKRYKSKVLDIKDGYDFNNAVAYFGFRATRHVGLQLGHGRHFIGNGYRSLFLSDFGANQFFLKVSTRVWKFHYQNLFLELTPSTARADTGQNLLPKKYAAIHYLNFRPRPNLAFGFFEATVFNRADHFEFQYLNPIILYRSVESLIGSPDNVLIGLDARWNFLHRFQLYGQVLFDEFRFAALYKARERGWWGNKYGVQAGLKYVNAFGIDHLDLQAELNIVRPYTYSHRDSLNAYTHYRQPLAHPLGSNFREVIGLVRWQPLHRLMFSGRIIRAELGENAPTENWGADPLLPNTTRETDYGNALGQGVSADLTILGLDASWMLYHNLFIDLKFLTRRKDSADDSRDLNTTVFGLGIRLNVWPQALDF